MDWTRETTPLVGRFQPWNEGHTRLFKQAFDKTGQVAILLKREDGTNANPYTFEERVGFIQKELYLEGYNYDEHYTVLDVPNLTEE